MIGCRDQWEHLWVSVPLIFYHPQRWHCLFSSVSDRSLSLAVEMTKRRSTFSLLLQNQLIHPYNAVSVPLPFRVHNQRAKGWQHQCYFYILISRNERARVGKVNTVLLTVSISAGAECANCVLIHPQHALTQCGGGLSVVSSCSWHKVGVYQPID